MCLVLTVLSVKQAKADGEVKVEGIFQGENLFIMNPFAASGVGFCIYEVTVNGKVTADEINCSAFEVDLTVYGMTEGEPVVVVLKHKSGCTPKVLNPDVLKPKSTFIASNLKLDKTGKLSWQTKEEKGSLPFLVEQFKWKKWIVIAKVDGKGTAGLNNYAVNINLHSGINKIRIKQVDYTKKPRFSEEITFNNLQPEVSFKPGNNGKTADYVTFSRSTDYEVYDYYGKRVLRGSGAQINVTSLPKGTYFLNYDCKSESFERR